MELTPLEEFYNGSINESHSRRDGTTSLYPKFVYLKDDRYHTRVDMDKFKFIFSENPLIRPDKLLRNSRLEFPKEFYDLFPEELRKQLYRNNRPRELGKLRENEYYIGIIEADILNSEHIFLHFHPFWKCSDEDVKFFMNIIKETGYLGYLSKTVNMEEIFKFFEATLPQEIKLSIFECLFRKF